jgi:hypothetical protein
MELVVNQQDETEVVLIDLYLRVLLAETEVRADAHEENAEHVGCSVSR